MSRGEIAQKRKPIMALLDVLGKRWVLRILWELRDGPLTFRALRAAAEEISPSVLNERLAELRAHGLVELESEGYSLTERSRSLSALLLDLDAWAKRHRFGQQES